jgi:DNA-binding transcriptional ArsR family regulator
MLFSSNTRVKLLKLFLLSGDDKEFFIREITRLLDEQINSVRRELDNLKKMGLLKIRNKNRKKYYRVNVEFLIYEELKSMFQKSALHIDEMGKKVSRMGKVDLLMLSGFFIGKEGGVDVLLVGDIDKDKFKDYLDGLDTGKELTYFILDRDDFLYRIECKDKFIGDILKEEKNLTLINKLDKILG